jgi:ubiquinone/menaquinone biosynthesis C-methylase UbiE
MSEKLQFGKEMSRIAVEMNKTDDVARRRQAVMKFLEPRSGEHVLDIGCGPGYVAKELGELVGSDGRVLGIDVNDQMIAQARSRCATLPWITFEPADAIDLPLPDASFDAAVSIQVLEYVEEVDLALSKMYRALRPGGRSIIVATDWDSIIWNSSTPDGMHRFLAAFSAHSVFTDLPRSLVRRLQEAGFMEISVQLVPQINISFNPESFGFHFANLVGTFVQANPKVSKEEVELWLRDFVSLSKRGEYFFNLNQFLFHASKTG